VKAKIVCGKRKWLKMKSTKEVGIFFSPGQMHSKVKKAI